MLNTYYQNKDTDLIVWFANFLTVNARKAVKQAI